MRTLGNTKTHKLKEIEIVFSNMTFVVWAHSHYMVALNNAGWSTTKYTATIKETGEGIGLMAGRKLLRQHMETVNSRPDLFLI